MAWKTKYPSYPDLTVRILGDYRARLVRNKTTRFNEPPTDDEHAQYLEDCRLYWPSMLALFVECVDTGQPIEAWVLEEFRRAFSRVLQGTVWEDSIPLPGREFKDEWYAYSPKERRDRKLCSSVRIGISCGYKVTEAMGLVATESHLSFETVRAAYYKWNAEFDELYSTVSKSIDETLEEQND